MVAEQRTTRRRRAGGRPARRTPAIACAAAALGSLAACAPAPDAGTTAADWPYSFVQTPFVHPRIVQDLSTWPSDRGDQVVAIDLLDSQGSNRYFGDVGARERAGQCPFVYWRDGAGGEFGYRYVGLTASNVHVLVTSDAAGGSGAFRSLLLLAIAFDAGVDCCDWDRQTVIRDDRPRLVARKLGEAAIGDRWSGDLRVTGNRLRIGPDEGWFARSGGSGGGGPAGGRELSIDVRPPGALDFGAAGYSCLRAGEPRTG